MSRDPAAALVAWRESIPYSQAEVGVLFGVVKSTVGHWERGRTAVPQRVQARLRVEGWLGRWRRVRYTADEDAWLVAHAGRWPITELTARLNTQFGVTRTPQALRQRLYLLGQSIAPAALLTRRQIAYYCGVSMPTVARWADRGWLELPPWVTRVARSTWAVPPEAVHAFIERHAEQLNVAAMPASPFQAHAAGCWHRERWLSADEAAHYAGVARATVRKWVARGQLSAVRQYRRTSVYWWRIRARDLTTFLRTREQRRTA